MAEEQTYLVKRDPERIYKAHMSFEYFVRVYMYADLTSAIPEFHSELYDFFDKGYRPNPPLRMLDIEPRDHGKTFRWNKFFPLWLFLCQPYEFCHKGIITLSLTAEFAETRLRAMKQELQFNPMILADFGNLLDKAVVDRVDLIELRDGRYIRAKGKGAQIRGFHPGVVIVDDLEDAEESENRSIREKDERYFFSDLYGVLEEYSMLFVVGTIVHEQSLLHNLWKDQTATQGWIKRKYSAIKDDGTALWPERWSIERLRQRQQEMSTKRYGSALFYREYLNIPMATETQAIRPEWIKWVDKVPHNHRDMYKIMCMDPAFSVKRKADYSALVVIGIVTFGPDKGDIFVLHRDRGHWSTDDKANVFMNNLERWQPDDYAVESVAEGADFFWVLAEKARTRNKYCMPQKLRPKPKEDKLSRAQSVADLFEHGRVHILASMRDMVEELLLLPDGDHDDMADALVWCLKLAKRGWLAKNKRPAAEIVKPKYLQASGGY